MMTGSIKPMTEQAWREYYSSNENFYRLFGDYKFLRTVSDRRTLSSAEDAQKKIIEELIDKKLH